MSVVLRHTALIALAAFLSWWILLRAPADRAVQAESTGKEAAELALDLVPYLATEEEVAEATVSPQAEEAAKLEPETAPAPPIPEPVAADPEVEEPEAQAPPPEKGTPEGNEESETASPIAAEEASVREVLEFMENTELLRAAELEVSGESRQGFETVLVAAPGEQLAIARAFGEEVVLIPKSAIDPAAERPSYFRVGPSGAVETVAGRPELTQFRQYRDLFDYEYSLLPEPIRTLRRSVLSRSEVFLFAALIPAPEWAVVIGRRRSALSASGRELSEVRRFTLSYVLRPNGHFDFVVDEIRFQDGTRFRPTEGEQP